MQPRVKTSNANIKLVLTIAISAVLFAGPVGAAPVPGFVESWSGTSTGGWEGGSIVQNPGSGGIGGAADGFLHVSTQFPWKLGSRPRVEQPEYSGDWQAAGIKTVKFWLKDVDADQDLEIHFGIGHRLNFWQYTEGFIPHESTWAEFSVDLTTESKFTQVIGPGTFDDALQNADRILIRHDKAPFQQEPDVIQGEFGIDQLLLTNELVPVLPTTWGRIKRLYR